MLISLLLNLLVMAIESMPFLLTTIPGFPIHLDAVIALLVVHLAARGLLTFAPVLIVRWIILQLKIGVPQLNGSPILALITQYRN